MNDRLEKILALLAFITIVIAGVLGVKREAGKIQNNVVSVIPDGYRAESTAENRFRVYNDSSGVLSYYITVEHSNGFGGKMDIAILADTSCKISDIKVIEHRETPSYLEKVRKKGLLNSLLGKRYNDQIEANNDIDIISGATYTSEAIIKCARIGIRNIASEELSLDVPEEKTTRFTVGVPEIALIVLYIIAFIGIYSGLKRKKLIRWITMLGGLAVLGLWFAVPLSLSKINTFLLGYWPDWHTEIYWYILVFGFIISVLVSRKNVYCHWICPVGCMQDILGAVGNAKPGFPKRIRKLLKWISRLIVWAAIVLALYFRNPVKLNYEIFGVAVNLTGATYLFILTGISFMAAVFIKRPWCNYLCPIVPIYDFLSLLRRKR